MFAIEYDKAQRVIRYRIEGFWTVADVAAFRIALLAELRTRSATGRPHVLGDASAFAVQSAAVASDIQKFMMGDVIPAVAKLALVVATMLNKLQVERAGEMAAMKVFLNEADALAWLNDASGA